MADKKKKPSSISLLLAGEFEFTDKDTKKKVPILGQLFGWMSGSGMDYGPIAAGLALILFVGGLVTFGVSAGQVLAIFFALTPLWLPVILFYLFYEKWMEMVGTAFSLSQGRTTLRIRLPQDVFKSPEAMEFVISQIHNTANPDNYMQTYLDGKKPLSCSFEIVSIGGEVRFYVNVPTKKVRDAFESNIYAQYPGVEVVEDPVDYAAEIPLDFESQDYEVMSFHMGKKKDGVFPIKTYVDYGLNNIPKPAEEEKLDPITPMLEVLSSAKPYERIFVQIVAVPFRVSSLKNGQLQMKEGPDWTADAAKTISKMMNRDPEKKTAVTDKESGKEEKTAILTNSERDTIAAIERNMTKYAYKTAIRWMYITKKGKFNGDLISPMIRSFSQYDMIGRNVIGVRWRTDFDYKSIIPGGKLKELKALKKQEIKEYRRRVVYPKNAAGGSKIFTSEELATMWHLPGRVAMTPTLDRVPSTRGEAPSNLPTGEFN